MRERVAISPAEREAATATAVITDRGDRRRRGGRLRVRECSVQLGWLGRACRRFGGKWGGLTLALCCRRSRSAARLDWFGLSRVATLWDWVWCAGIGRGRQRVWCSRGSVVVLLTGSTQVLFYGDVAYASSKKGGAWRTPWCLHRSIT
jgi:hypothetical protein